MYVRVDGITSNHLPNKSGTYLVGFNYLWLGCPQSLCLSGTIDAATHAATRLTNGSVYVFRGNYYWDLKYPPLVKYAKSADKQYVWNWESIAETHHLSDVEFLHKIDASFHVTNKSVYYFRGNKYLIHNCPFHPFNTEDLDIPWDQIDAAFADNNAIAFHFRMNLDLCLRTYITVH
ncbi:unnamed protein product [Oppiella nova]|uniref:Hemopexin n=1 Tax=Oppiella nova TaxID=334625 RepID=A0A7R9MFM6_9ACAR|nr:unnamed protein product [Oppiella nova]CAG2176130.1 unnamed protein product [Oppiella nova]